MSAPTVYAVCVDCSATFANQDEARAHGNDTMEPTGEAGVIARGHGWRVTNPSPEELDERRIRNTVSSAVEDAIYDAMDSLQSAVERGKVTAAEVREGLIWYPEFRDAWDEYDS